MGGIFGSLQTFLRRHLVESLSGRLLMFTTLFVMLAEVLIYFPSAARYYLNALVLAQSLERLTNRGAVHL